MILADPDKAAPFYEARRKSLQEKIVAQNLDALLVTNLVNVRYLSGFSGTAATCVVTPDDFFFLTDFRYITQAKEEVRGATLRESREFFKTVGALFSDENLRKVGFEADHVSAAKAAKMSTKFEGATLVSTSGMVEGLRLLKDEAEIEAIEKLLIILAAVYPKVIEMIAPGKVEKDIAIEAEYLLKKGGSDGAAFDFIVASGVRSAMPHGVASEKVIEKGELVTLDWGCKGFGYHTDNTRTVAMGDIDDELKNVYDIVLEANRAAIDFVRPGVTVKQLDVVARDLIAKAGYADAFGHGTGHGVGLEIHEKPSVSWREETMVEVGMVFTIEPGVYLPGKGGVRIEDMVAVTESGCKTLTKAIPKEFLSL